MVAGLDEEAPAGGDDSAGTVGAAEHGGGAVPEAYLAGDFFCGA